MSNKPRKSLKQKPRKSKAKIRANIKMYNATNRLINALKLGNRRELTIALDHFDQCTGWNGHKFIIYKYGVKELDKLYKKSLKKV